MAGEVLSQRALNRAMLSRQLMLDQAGLPEDPGPRRAAVIRAIEHLVGLQAQAPFPPYYGLWSRLPGFRPDDLASLHTSAEHWLGRHARAVPWFPETLSGLVTRYLAAFGPATVADVAAWSGLTGLRAVLEELRPALVTFRDDQGTELFDLPSAPRPDPEVPAPVRLAAEFDNLLLAHADRTRLISAANLKRFYTINGVFPGSVLVDGFVAGMWRLARRKGWATLAIELFGPVPDRDLVAHQAERMLAFCAPDVAHEIRFSPA